METQLNPKGKGCVHGVISCIWLTTGCPVVQWSKHVQLQIWGTGWKWGHGRRLTETPLVFKELQSSECPLPCMDLLGPYLSPFSGTSHTTQASQRCRTPKLFGVELWLIMHVFSFFFSSHFTYVYRRINMIEWRNQNKGNMNTEVFTCVGRSGRTYRVSRLEPKQWNEEAI